ncbi:RNA polymerase sigma factor [Micromonospora cathayae]|uniref:Sigma-70 family RNA polymerase sigma factor n=1 Tax=Micromonospora cathayae TaxID=3028804 RepID=A0ABY7ZM47_9ACTN|nr:sigma-70 family RNA polymerase sigma factor [Micromonospora sp. HUAS 3]WDZ83972.1 sigma-70 family RNA polymerase sigma factor [Micromonospora sp. HUAS 3]
MDDRTPDKTRPVSGFSTHQHRDLVIRDEDDLVVREAVYLKTDLVVREEYDDASEYECKRTPAQERPEKPTRQQVVEEFREFFLRFAGRLAAWLQYLGVPPAEAKDVTQETMRKAYRRWDSIDNPEAWVRVVASREWAARLAKVDAIPVEDVEEHLRHNAGGCEIAAADTRHDVREAVRKLPPRQRQVLAWSYEGYTPAEIAEHLSMTPEAVRSSLYQGRQKLERLLRPQESGDQ